ncbi:hypothetical protein RHMOL_Rhmol10G0028800 [Rhododendron molle]|uniref:Uncharacterized protein n=1 Tax=Rhododendron molle TaxID=49168 RepID=A0ACC0LZH6_RHOML|nr:hypothetical protein RHMOL_Rhmol10G0028800 [Rhododendron molle]
MREKLWREKSQDSWNSWSSAGQTDRLAAAAAAAVQSGNRMEENPSRARRENGSGEACCSRRGPTTRSNCRRPAEEVSGDLNECSGKHCQSCIGGLVADCVALCCCPCAVVSFFALAFFKAPWMMGRRCLGLGKKKKKEKRKCEGEIEGNSRNGRAELEITETGIGFEDWEAKDGDLSARFESERVWLELYQLGHLGFGRVSFTGVPSQAAQAHVQHLMVMRHLGLSSMKNINFFTDGAADGMANWGDAYLGDLRAGSNHVGLTCEPT